MQGEGDLEASWQDLAAFCKVSAAKSAAGRSELSREPRRDSSSFDCIKSRLTVCYPQAECNETPVFVLSGAGSKQVTRNLRMKVWSTVSSLKGTPS